MGYRFTVKETLATPLESRTNTPTALASVCSAGFFFFSFSFFFSIALSRVKLGSCDVSRRRTQGQHLSPYTSRDHSGFASQSPCFTLHRGLNSGRQRNDRLNPSSGRVCLSVWMRMQELGNVPFYPSLIPPLLSHLPDTFTQPDPQLLPFIQQDVQQSCWAIQVKCFAQGHKGSVAPGAGKQRDSYCERHLQSTPLEHLGETQRHLHDPGCWSCA